MSSVIRLRRGTSAQWASSTLVLAPAELGLDTTLNKLKVGNGLYTWVNLPFINVLPSELAELSQDAINSALVMGLHMTKTYDDTLNTITVSSTLTNVDNTSDADKPISTATSAALALKAPLANPALTGIPTAPTAVSTTNTTQIATTEFVQTAIANVIDMAPGALDTLNELAAAINDDASYAATVTEVLGTKASLTGPETLSNKTLFRPTITTAGNSTTQTLSTLIVSKFLGATASIVVEAASPIASAIAGDTIVFSDVPSLSSYTYVVGSKLIFDGNASINFSNSQYQSGAQAPMFAWASDGATNFTTATVFSSQEDVTISSAEIGRLDGVTSNIQTQINLKAPLENPTFTGTVSGITKTMVGLGNVDNTSDLDKPISSLTATRIGLLETQVTDGLAAKVDKATIPTLKSDTDYTINNQTDRYNRIEFDASTAITVTIPTNINDPWPVGSSCEIMQAGTGKITVVGQSGVTLRAPDNQFKTRVQWSTLILEKRGTNDWLVSGDSDL
jgi:hypothetical protein